MGCQAESSSYLPCQLDPQFFLLHNHHDLKSTRLSPTVLVLPQPLAPHELALNLPISMALNGLRVQEKEVDGFPEPQSYLFYCVNGGLEGLEMWSGGERLRELVGEVRKCVGRLYDKENNLFLKGRADWQLALVRSYEIGRGNQTSYL
jgi:hypothetical protein